MPAEYDPAYAQFDPKDCGTPMIEAVRELAQQVGEPYESFIGRSLADLGQLAKAHYEDMPEFWRVWHAWHAPQPRPEMGDL